MPVLGGSFYVIWFVDSVGCDFSVFFVLLGAGGYMLACRTGFGAYANLIAVT